MSFKYSPPIPKNPEDITTDEEEEDDWVVGPSFFGRRAENKGEQGTKELLELLQSLGNQENEMDDMTDWMQHPKKETDTVTENNGIERNTLVEMEEHANKFKLEQGQNDWDAGDESKSGRESMEFMKLGEKVKKEGTEKSYRKEETWRGERSNPKTRGKTISMTENENEPEHGGGSGSEKRYQGLVAALRETFGFIESIEYPDRIFFHFTEFHSNDPSLTSNNMNTNTNSSSNNNNSNITTALNNNGRGIGLKLGDEVSFRVSKNEKKAKDDAIDVRLLPKGTVPTEEGLKRDIHGILQRLARTKRSVMLANASSGNGKKGKFVDAELGSIRVCHSDGTEESMVYHFEDVQDYRIAMYVGDEVVFDVIFDHRIGKKRATNVCFFKATPQRRYHGIIYAIEKDHAILKASEVDREIILLWNNYAPDFQSELEVGRDLEFKMEEENGILYAKDAQIINSHVDEPIEEVVRGIVEKDMVPKHLAKFLEQEPKSGLIRAVTGPDRGLEFPFTEDDLHQGWPSMRKGDDVEFLIIMDPVTKKRRAHHIILLKSLSEERCTGILASIKDGIGMIKLQDDEKEISFALKEYWDEGKKRDLTVGDDLDFVLLKKGTQKYSIRVKALDRWINFTKDIIEYGARGIISQELRGISRTATGARNVAMAYGGRIDRRKNAEFIAFPFQGRDLLDFTHSLRVGDKVEFNVGCDYTTDKKYATDIVRLDPAALLDNDFDIIAEKEIGYIHSLRDGFGFLRTPGRDGNLFFHFSEFKDGEAEMKVGIDVEYMLVMDKKVGKPSAIRVHKTKEKSIDVTTHISEKLTQGIVRVESVNKHFAKMYGEEMHTGEIEVLNTTSLLEQGMLLSFGDEDIEKGWSGLHAGDLVEFYSAAGDSRSSRRRATKILLKEPATEKRHIGIVTSLKETFGFLKSKDLENEIFFHFTEFPDDGRTLLRLFDEVEFSSVLHGGKPYAVRLKTILKGTLGRKESGIVESVHGSTIRLRARSNDIHTFNVFDFELKESLNEGDEVDYFLYRQLSSDQDEESPFKEIVWKVKRIKESQVSSLQFSKRSANPVSSSSSSLYGTSPNPPSYLRREHGHYSDTLSSSSPSLTFNLTDISPKLSASSVILRAPKGPDGTKGFSYPRSVKE